LQQRNNLSFELKYLLVRPLLVFCLILGLSLPVILIIQIDQVNARVPGNEPSSASGFGQLVAATVFVVGSPPSLQQTPISFPTLSPTPTLFLEQVSTPKPSGISAFTLQNEVTAFIHAPPGVLPQPYVILTAFSSTPGSKVEIRGRLNLLEFVCTGSPCALPVSESSTVTFTASDDQGNTSKEILARVRVETVENGYLVFIDSVNQFASFRDSCSDLWRVKDEVQQPWSEFPQSPFGLNTDRTYHLLITELISNGIVDAKSCPGGGLASGGDWPTGCGVERATAKMIEWQNQFDLPIWTASLEVGIPPKLLKSIIGYESQFWPLNARFYVDEIGLGQINQLGVDVLLRQNPALYQEVCSGVLSDCFTPYANLDPAQQAMIRGALLNSVDASCATCPNGIDLTKAAESIPLIAQMLQANCKLIDYLDVPGKTSVEYSDLWKFTLASYHSGYSCVKNAVAATRKAEEREDWEHVSPRIRCKGTVDYVNGLWDNLLSFDLYLLSGESLGGVQVAPTFLPTRTPIPPPTAIPSHAKVWVRVYIDTNKNGVPDELELLDGITVELVLRNQTRLVEKTVKGEVIFDMTGYPAGMDAIVSLPGLYREKLITLPEEGTVQIDFMFSLPPVPEKLP